MLPSVLDLLAPARCLSCRRRAEPPWCTACSALITEAPAPGCSRCGGPRRHGHGCWPPRVPIASTTVRFDYRGPLPPSVVTAKIGGAHAAWSALGAELAQRIIDDPPVVDVVTWVPTDPARVRRRGVDHAAVLAAVVGRALAMPCLGLLRPGRGGTGPRIRRELPGTDVLLVDDVLTTGRTALAAAAGLVAGGAGRIHLAVLARAGDHVLADLPGRPRTRRPAGRPAR